MLQLLANAVAVNDQNKLKKLMQKRRSLAPICPQSCQGCESGIPAQQGCNTLGEPPIPSPNVGLK